MPTLSYWRHRDLGRGLYFYAATSLVAVLGALVGHAFLQSAEQHAYPPHGGSLEPFTNWDGLSYEKIATDGYSYDSKARSNVVLFPAYPLLGRFVHGATGMPLKLSMVVVAHFCLAGTFVVMIAYMRRRFPDESRTAEWTALAFGLWPATFFFRMAYTEALLLFLAVLLLHGMDRKWPLLVLALIVGLATATRSVGVALIPPLLLHVWRSMPPAVALGSESRPAHRGFTALWHYRSVRLAVVLPLAGWGIIAYMVYLNGQFGEPLAFATNQPIWDQQPFDSYVDNFLTLTSLEPLWAAYDPDSPGYWRREKPDLFPFNLLFANPICFAFITGTVLLGWYKRWLNESELLLAAGLLLIPYVTKGYELLGHAFARYSAVALPAYFVMGKLLSRLPGPFAAALLAVCAFFLGIWSALFAAWYNFI